MKLYRIPLRSEPWPIGRHERRPCPICNKPWDPCARSRLDCHAACLLTDEARAQLVHLWDVDNAAPMHELSERYGVTEKILLMTLRAEGIDAR